MQEKPSFTLPQEYFLAVVCVLFWSFYVMGWIFPDYWWTTHHLAFLPPTLRILCFLVGSYFLLRPVFKKHTVSLDWVKNRPIIQQKAVLPVFISLLFAGLIYSFPIAKDYFGDASLYQDFLERKVPIIPEEANDVFFSFGVSPWDGRNSVLALVTYIAYFGGIAYSEAFIILDLLCGFLFGLVWLGFIQFYFQNRYSKVIMGFAGLSAPFTLIFYGHFETYAPLILLYCIWLSIFIKHISEPIDAKLWGLFALFVLSLKLHAVSLLLLPAMLILFLNHYVKGNRKIEALINWKGIFQYLLAPIFLFGAILYFFVFQDYADSRDFSQEVLEFDHLFLPLLSPDPPLENYNLLSWNHIFDYFSEILLWSPICMMLLLIIGLGHVQQIPWEKLEIRVLGLSLILFSCFFFMINPLLSMQLDWDLFSLPAPFFLFFSAVVLKQIEKRSLPSKLLSPALGLVILCIPNFLTHSDEEALSDRYISLGVRVYHSYYQRAQTIIYYGLNMKSYISTAEYEKHNNEIIELLKPYARERVDFEFARLYSSQGKFFLRVVKDYEKAIFYLKKGEAYFPRERNLVLYLMETQFLRGEYDEAFAYSQELMRQGYPSEKKSLAIGIQCALEAELFQEAGIIAAHYVNNWSDNAPIQEVFYTLNSGASPDSLKYLFIRKE